LKAINDLSTGYVRSILSYEPLSGELTWLKTLSNRAVAGSKAGASRKDGRKIIAIDGRDYVAARLIWLIVTGEWPPADVDHRDLDKGNDRWDNLRLATRSQNFFNKLARRDNASGFKGVSYDSARDKYAADIQANGKRVRLGRFDTAEEASRAYRAAAIREHGEFARF
jgi:hypothetical protein